MLALNSNKNNIIKEENKGGDDLYISKINKDFIIFNEKNEFKGKIWFKNLIYGGKKFYIMTKTNSILNNSDISYYCCNHRTLKNSKDGKRHDLCDCHIIYKVLEDEYTLINSHSKECLAFDKIIYNNIIEVNREINNYNNYKDILIKKLNSDPLISYGHFKKWATDIYRNSDYNFEIKKIQ